MAGWRTIRRFMIRRNKSVERLLYISYRNRLLFQNDVKKLIYSIKCSIA